MVDNVLTRATFEIPWLLLSAVAEDAIAREYRME
jgi:hypothetical protein